MNEKKTVKIRKCKVSKRKTSNLQCADFEQRNVKGNWEIYMWVKWTYRRRKWKKWEFCAKKERREGKAPESIRERDESNGVGGWQFVCNAQLFVLKKKWGFLRDFNFASNYKMLTCRLCFNSSAATWPATVKRAMKIFIFIHVTMSF